MNITNDQTKILSFPHKRSIGTLYSAPIKQPEEWQLLTQVRGLVVAPENEPIHWELFDEARGDIAVPPAMKLKLKISPDAAGLSGVANLEADDLHALDLSHSAVTDKALSHIEHLEGLRFLELTSTTVGDKGLSFIHNLIGLHSIGLSYTRVTSAGLKHLWQLKDLREIWLSGNKVDDLGLEHLNNLQTILQLGLSSTLITDAGLLNLVKLKKLLRVYLFNTKVTHSGAQLLKNLLPACKVKWHPPKVHARDGQELISLDNSTQEFNSQRFQPPPNSSFDENDFWKLINLLDWQAEGDDGAVIAPVLKELAKRNPEDIFQFSEILAQKLYLLDGENYAREIGADSYSGNKGNFAKNWFLYVRCCAVANGHEYYSSVLQDPKQMPKDIEFQALLNIAPQAYKLKTGQRFNYVTQHNYETFSNKQLWVNK